VDRLGQDLADHVVDRTVLDGLCRLERLPPELEPATARRRSSSVCSLGDGRAARSAASSALPQNHSTTRLARAGLGEGGVGGGATVSGCCAEVMCGRHSRAHLDRLASGLQAACETSFSRPMSGAEPERAMVEPSQAGLRSIRTPKPPPAPLLTTISRALILVGAVGASIGLAIGTELIKGPLDGYLTANTLGKKPRTVLLAIQLGSAVGAVAVAAVVAWLRRRNAATPARLSNAARRLAPMGVVGFLPLLFRWRAWEGRDLAFLMLTSVAVLCFSAGLRLATASEPFGWEAWLRRRARAALPPRPWSWQRAQRAAPWLVVAGALGYAAYFAYVTCAWYHGVHGGRDLASENNTLWNLIHGGRFGRSSPALGPTGTNLGHQATLFAFVLAPIYALAQRPETLLAIQAVLVGAAAVPLYLFARRYLGAGASCLVAFAYLLYPPVHGANLFEFHYLPLAAFFVWTALYALESRRDVLGAVAVVLALSVHEDVAVGLIVVGVYLVLSGRRARAGVIVAGAAAVYFLVMKLVVMPRFLSGGGETFASRFPLLLPAGETSFAGVLKTVIGNPIFTLSALLDTGRLVYVLVLLVPLAFLPLRHPLAPLFVVPGVLFTLLATVQGDAIHAHHPAHWIPYLFIALVLALARLAPPRRPAAIGGLVLGLLACSYEYGAILQTNTSYSGVTKLRFGMSQDDQKRRRELDALLRELPPNAKVASSDVTLPRVSSRASAYSLAQSLYDAEYLLLPSEAGELAGAERPRATELLSSGAFGVVSVQPPFVLARRGHPTDKNAALLATWR
jgi:uncharacterized membrane protein